MVTDRFLRAANEAALRDALAVAGINSDAPAGAGWALDMIGVILRPTGATEMITGPDGEPVEVPVVAPVEGWHANLRLLTEDAVARAEVLAPFIIAAPATPERGWA